MFKKQVLLTFNRTSNGIETLSNSKPVDCLPAFNRTSNGIETKSGWLDVKLNISLLIEPVMELKHRNHY